MRKSLLLKGQLALGFLVILFLNFNISNASDPKDIDQAQLTGHCELNGSAAFLLTDESTNYPGTAAVTCSAQIKVPNQTVLQVDMRVNWNAQDFIALDSITYPLGTGAINSQGSGTVYFSVDVPDNTYPNFTTVAKLWFRMNCFSSTDVTFANFCTESKIHSGAPVHFYYPISVSSGTITRNPPLHTMKPLRDSSTINDTLEIPVLYSCTTAASVGFGSSWEYPKDSLDLVDVYNSGRVVFGSIQATPDESTDPAKLRIYFNGTVPRTDVLDTIFYIRFKNTMHVLNAEAKVVRLTDTLKFCDGPNSDVLGIITNRDSANARTYYQAEFRFKDTSAVTNSIDVPFKTQLKNNFVVRLRDSSDVSRFKIDNTSWSKITWKSFENSDANYRWVQDPPTEGNKKIKNDTGSPQNIPRSAALVSRTVTHKVDVGGTTGTQNANVIDDSYTKLKDVNANITITPTTGITLTTGVFTVTTPPSCPFLYVWNGNDFVEDNTILTQAEYSAKEQTVTDYYHIQTPLVDKDNQYYLQLRELSDEKSFIDKIELLSVDHAIDKKIAVTPEGKIFYVGEALVPASAIDDQGEEHIDEVNSKDGVLYSSDEPGQLILTYELSDKTWKGPMVLGGDGPPKDPHGPPGGGRVSPNEPREPILHLVKTEIQDINGTWLELTQAPPRDNYSVNYWLVDQNQIQLGTTFKVKISWQKSYSADEIKFYAVSDQTPLAIALTPISVSHSNSTSLTKLISAEDYQFATLVKGEKLDLFFPAENLPLQEGYTREFIIKASGYYIPYTPEPTASIPDRFELKDNYPNPFNAQTEIQYGLPEPSEVNLSVYNIMGQKVRTLVEGRQSAGVHRVTWDGRNENGETVASGVYFYTIRAGTYIETKKMTLLK